MTADFDDVVEEVWTTKDGTNVFDEDKFETHMISFGYGDLQYQSFTEDMTPLDMTFKETNNEFYDGTGNLVWLAALVFAHLLQLQGDYDDDSVSKKLNEIYLGERICELGCGTGVAGIAALLARSSGNGSCSRHVLFTDNDAEALELCRTNCRLNQLKEGADYSLHLLNWGEEPYPSPSNFDTVLATDVLYDIVMIPPLMKTAASILKDSGFVLLSHVPRFCLPNDEEVMLENSKNAYDKLESHIIEQAEKVGLFLVETVRPHKILESSLQQSKKEASSSPLHPQLSPERLEEMHATLLTFQKR